MKVKVTGFGIKKTLEVDTQRLRAAASTICGMVKDSPNRISTNVSITLSSEGHSQDVSFCHTDCTPAVRLGLQKLSEKISGRAKLPVHSQRTPTAIAVR